MISHSSADAAVARRLEQALEAQGLDVWLDASEIRLGVLLGPELQAAIRGAGVLVLLWSRAAAASRWVNSEWLMAIHLDRFVVACALDDEPLPQSLRNSVYLTGPKLEAGGADQLARAIREPGVTALAPVMRRESPELREAIRALAVGQNAMLERLGARKLGEAEQIQALLDDAMEHARGAFGLDPMIVNLDGYHLKNAYMLAHWDAIQAGRAPDDPLLDLAERRFFETLAIDPHDPSPLNGLGSILTFRRDLYAAEFFIEAALAAAARRGMQGYAAAETDLALVRELLG